MRSTMILAALAVGTCAKVVQKEVYVTEWTTTTVTETITQWPNGPTSTALVEHIAPTTKLVEAPVPTVDLSRKATAAAVDSAPAPAAPAPTAPAVEVESVQTSSATTSSVTTSAVITSSTSSAEPIQPVTSSTTSSAAPVETSSAAAPSSTASSSSTASAGGSYQDSVLENHNIHRRVHSADDMTWSAELEDIARQIAEKCVYAHDTSVGDISYGQNIAYGVQEAQVGEQVITAMMYENEEPVFAPYYGEANPTSSFSAWGHFTQIVWKGTKQVGCYTYTCPSLDNTGGATNSPFTVCNYSPPGNYAGEYAENVSKPSS